MHEHAASIPFSIFILEQKFVPGYEKELVQINLIESGFIWGQKLLDQ